MDRKERIADSQFYHVYNRGNNRNPVFGDRSDYRAFIKKLESLAAKHLIDVAVFTLMPNHYHLIVMQKPGGSLSNMMGALGTSAAARFNLKYGHIGHLFQGPFKFKAISEEALWHVACYIHLNPVRARLVNGPEEWEFSNFVEDFLLRRKSNGERGPLLWKGYTEYVKHVLADEEAEKVYLRKVHDHIARFRPNDRG